MRRRTLPALVALVALLATTGARAHIAVEPLRDVLREANADVFACATRHHLEDGRYATRLTVDLATGKVDAVEVTHSPGELSAAAQSCVEAAFSRLAFPAFTPAPEPAATVAVGARRVPIPRMRPSVSGGGGIVQIHWPFVLRAGS